MVCNQTEAILSDSSFAGAPQLQACVAPEGWVPIASLLNYSPLGATVWPFGGVGVVADCLHTRGSHLIELSGDLSCVRKKPLRVQVRSAIEWIFSDENYNKDVHLQLLHEDGGFVPLLKILSSYNTVQQLLMQVHAAPVEPACSLAAIPGLAALGAGRMLTRSAGRACTAHASGNRARRPRIQRRDRAAPERQRHRRLARASQDAGREDLLAGRVLFSLPAYPAYPAYPSYPAYPAYPSYLAGRVLSLGEAAAG